MATSAPQPQPPATPAVPPKKGTSPLVWILIGCGGLIVIGTIVIGGVFWWGAHKLKNYAEEANKNPAIFTAKMIVAASPELEVVSEDQEKGTLTVRNTKTGEVITMDAKEISEGKLKFTDEKGKEVTFEGSGGEGQGGLKVTSDEGTMTVGSGSSGEPLPSWVPSYPGVTPMSTLSKTGEDELYGNYSFQTSDSVEKVLEYFETELKAAGFTLEKSNVQSGVLAMGHINAKTDDGRRTVDVSVIPVDKIAQVTVQYSETGGTH